ncbi:MAG TPA: hypothetical protein VFY94_10135 [Rhodanobacteraceae bacterium]|nr:hypothetical protein [Rhodanobacteraceae bacterium]
MYDKAYRLVCSRPERLRNDKPCWLGLDRHSGCAQRDPESVSGSMSDCGVAFHPGATAMPAGHCSCQPRTLMLRQSRGFANICSLFPVTATMLETNPIRAHIADLRERVESLRGYL